MGQRQTCDTQQDEAQPEEGRPGQLLRRGAEPAESTTTTRGVEASAPEATSDDNPLNALIGSGVGRRKLAAQLGLSDHQAPQLTAASSRVGSWPDLCRRSVAVNATIARLGFCWDENMPGGRSAHGRDVSQLGHT